MSTSGSFTPPDNPCPTDVMTAAALVALRDAGNLRPECHYFVQGPTIGTPGNTSPTILELHAVTASTLSKEAKVRQNFNPEGAFLGYYDPDADTANGGTINELIDHWNNRLADEDAGNAATHTVHNQFPFHLSGPLLRDNIADDTDLPGLAAFVTAGGEFRDNELRETSVDLTGVTNPAGPPSSFFRRNRINSGSFTAHVPTIYVNNNDLNNSTISHLGTGAASFSFQNNVALNGSVAVDAATTSQVTVNSNVFGSSTNPYRLVVQGKTVALFSFIGNRCFDGSLAGTGEYVASGTGQQQVTGCQFNGGVFTASAPGTLTVSGADFISATVTHTGNGNLTLARPFIRNGTIVHAGDGLLTSSNVEVLNGAALRTVTGQTGLVNITGSRIVNSYTVQVEGTATASLTLDGTTLTGHNTVGTALDLQVDGAGSRNLNDCTITAVSNQTGLVLVGSGPVSLGACQLRAARVVRDPATSAQLVMSGVSGTGTVQQGAGATVGALSLSATTLDSLGLNVNQQGPGSITSNSSRIGSTVQNSATATRGLSLISCDLTGGTLSQNRTGGTGMDTVYSLVLKGVNSSVTLQGAADPGGAQTPVNVVTVDAGARLTLTDPVGNPVQAICLQNSHLTANAIVNGTGTLLVTHCRFAAGCTVNLGAFAHDTSIVEGALTVNPTTGNINKLANKSFNDWV